VALRWIQVGSNCPLEFTTPLSWTSRQKTDSPEVSGAHWVSASTLQRKEPIPYAVLLWLFFLTGQQWVEPFTSEDQRHHIEINWWQKSSIGYPFNKCILQFSLLLNDHESPYQEKRTDQV
jgi:hypothetical protein